MKNLNVLVLAVLFLSACAPGAGPHKPVAPAAAPPSGAAPSAAGVEVVGYDRVRPIFARICAACHPARSGPDWLDFNQAHNYALNGKLKQRAVVEKSMPPPGSPQAAQITDQERELLGRFVDGGGQQTSQAATAAAPGAQAGAAPESGGGNGKAPAFVQQCLQCHGLRGPGSEAQPKIPRLGGQNEAYLLEQVTAFKWRERIDPSNTMNDMLSGVPEERLKELAHYFSGQSGLVVDGAPKMNEQQQKLFNKGQELAEASCKSCHMNPDFDNHTTAPEIPVLAGQSEQYLINQLLYFRNMERKNELMNEFAKNLSNDDIAALAFFFSMSR